MLGVLSPCIQNGRLAGSGRPFAFRTLNGAMQRHNLGRLFADDPHQQVSPQQQRLAALVEIGRPDVGAVDAAFVLADMVQQFTDDMRLHTGVGQPRRKRPSQVVRSSAFRKVEPLAAIRSSSTRLDLLQPEKAALAIPEHERILAR